MCTVDRLSYYFPFFGSYEVELAIVDVVNQLSHWDHPALEDIEYDSNLKLQAFIAFFVHQKPLGYTFSKAVFKVLDKVLEISLVSKVKTSRIELINIYSILDY